MPCYCDKEILTELDKAPGQFLNRRRREEREIAPETGFDES